ASGAPAIVTTERLWPASIDQSSRRTPSTRIAFTIASTRRESLPSEKFGTHSTTASLTRSPTRLHEPQLLFRSPPECISHLHLNARVHPRIAVAQRSRRDVYRVHAQVQRPARAREIVKTESPLRREVPY